MDEGGSPITGIVEALIFAASEPVSDARIRNCLGGGDEIEIGEEIRRLNAIYAESGRSFKIIEVAGGYQMVTNPEYEQWVRRLFVHQGRLRLSQAGLETLSIIAYRQPVSKPEIEAIRGVNSDGVVRTLLERNLVTVKGRQETPGRPILYGTTQEFLRYFGLNSLSELPALKEIEEIIGAPDEEHET